MVTLTWPRVKVLADSSMSSSESMSDAQRVPAPGVTFMIVLLSSLHSHMYFPIACALEYY